MRVAVERRSRVIGRSPGVFGDASQSVVHMYGASRARALLEGPTEPQGEKTLAE